MPLHELIPGNTVVALDHREILTISRGARSLRPKGKITIYTVARCMHAGKLIPFCQSGQLAQRTGWGCPKGQAEAAVGVQHKVHTVPVHVRSKKSSREQGRDDSTSEAEGSDGAEENSSSKEESEEGSEDGGDDSAQ